MRGQYVPFAYYSDVTKLVNSSGTVVVDYTYDAFGNQTSETEDSNPFRYAGEYWDSESGLIYLRARYYDAGIGSFTQEDPARDGLNWYVYANNNPLRYTDSTGKYAEGDEYLPIELQIILNGTDRKSGGLTAAWYAANARGDQAAMDRISNIAANIRKFSVNNINRVMVLVQSAGANGLGHTAVLLLNESDQGLLFSYHPYPDGAPSAPGEMRIGYFNATDWNNILYREYGADLIGSNGYNRSENFNGNLYLTVSADNGKNALAKAASIFANPGQYHVVTNNCDHQTQAIVTAAGKYYDKHIAPNDSFYYTTMYHTNYWYWAATMGL